ncbi:hypothetical protein LAUMK136_05136 [Mycobacterium attenuatum]|uniref:DUF4232 domain-containing protein n=1 Tax=Mycobacterium attenuatum TaxID=2341086 RepID=A0A498QDX9_9MYCO|nr:DUF4232 domain-containing protein [Mycobacterium attenuatum]VBA43531.1 hypothetical protein LAUMK136_05136 [Mycobacterium attenuatum]
MVGVPGFRLRSNYRLAIAAATLAVAAAAPLSPPAGAAPADQPPPCSAQQLTVTAGQPQAAVGHRAVTLTFALADGATDCTLSGYPTVDSGAGGPLLHAQHTPRGYMGGLPATVDVAPTVALTQSQRAQAVVEGTAIDGDGNPCPTYTDLRVTPPGTTTALIVPTGIEACELQVHPVVLGSQE